MELDLSTSAIALTSRPQKVILCEVESWLRVCDRLAATDIMAEALVFVFDNLTSWGGGLALT